MLREQVITAWNDLKDQITNTFNHLKQQNNPEIHNLQNQLLTKAQEIEVKREQLAELWKEIVPVLNETDDTNNQSYHDQIEQIESEMSKLEEERQSLITKLEIIWPQQAQITKLQNQLTKLNYLSSLEASLQERALENSQYLLRIARAEEKWGNSEKKLEQVRDLLAVGLTSKLFELYKKGKI